MSLTTGSGLKKRQVCLSAALGRHWLHLFCGSFCAFVIGRSGNILLVSDLGTSCVQRGSLGGMRQRHPRHLLLIYVLLDHFLPHPSNDQPQCPVFTAIASSARLTAVLNVLSRPAIKQTAKTTKEVTAATATRA